MTIQQYFLYDLWNMKDYYMIHFDRPNVDITELVNILDRECLFKDISNAGSKHPCSKFNNVYAKGETKSYHLKKHL